MSDVLDVFNIFRMHAYARVAHGRGFLKEFFLLLFVVLCNNALVVGSQTHHLALLLSA